MKRKNSAMTMGGAAALALTLTFALGACSTGGDQPAQTTEPAPAASQPAAATSSPSPGTGSGTADTISARDAVGIATDHTPGDVVEVDADDHRGAAVWEVTVRAADGSGTELYIDRASGDVIEEKSTNISDDQRESPSLSVTDAIDAVLAAEPGTLTHIDLDRENGTAVWEADVRTESGSEAEITIDATSGDVLKHEIDD